MRKLLSPWVLIVNMSVKDLVPKSGGWGLLLLGTAVMFNRDIVFDTDSLEFSGCPHQQTQKIIK